jgi:hypothetical protein
MYACLPVCLSVCLPDCCLRAYLEAGRRRRRRRKRKRRGSSIKDLQRHARLAAAWLVLVGGGEKLNQRS